MRRFLHETYELWYWAFCCPSKLQYRLNEWKPRWRGKNRVNTNPSDVLLLKYAHPRFLAQHSLLIFTLSIPLIIAVAFNPHMLVWTLIPVTLLCAHAVSVISLNLGTNLPLLFFYLYILQAETFHISIDDSFSHLPSAIYLIGGAAVISIFYIVTWRVGRFMSEVERNFGLTFRNIIVLIIIGGLPVLLGTGAAAAVTWQTNQSLLTKIAISILSFSWLAGVLLTSRGLYNSRKSAAEPFYGWLILLLGSAAVITTLLTVYRIGGVMATIVEVISFVIIISVIGSSITSLIFTDELIQHKVTLLLLVFLFICIGTLAVFAISGVVGGVVISFTKLPAFYFMTACWLISVCIAPKRAEWVAFIVASITMMLLGLQGHGWLILLIPVVTLLGYCRIVPDYTLLSLVSLWCSFRISIIMKKDPVYWLYKLPPHISELLWIPLPKHDNLLVACFQSDPNISMKTLQAMESSPFWGLRYTVNRSRPRLVADQLVSISNIGELLSLATLSHSSLPQLVPSIYRQAGETQHPDQQGNNANADINLTPDIQLVLPHVQTIARDVKVALASGTASLREHGLVKCLDDLGDLESNLPKLGFEGTALARWLQVFGHLKSIIDAEIEQQQQQSYKEITNPFQSGTPLRPDRANLFKGRTLFADEIKRQLFDRSRPTLILHGPRRCGKTSFLYNLERLLPSDMIPIFVDLQESSHTNGVADFLLCLIRAISSKLPPSSNVQIPTHRKMQSRAFPIFRDWLEQVLPLFGSRRVLLCLDEFEKLGQAVYENRVSPRVFDSLRHLIQHNDRINFLFAGVQTLEELGPNWSSYFINLRPIEMVYLEPDEARELLTQPEPDFELKYTDGVVERILDLTHYHPYLIQLLGESLVKQANLNHTRKINERHLDSAMEDALTSGAPYFSNLWDEFTGKTPEEVLIGRKILLAIASKGPMPSLNNDVAKAALQRLTRYHVIVRKGTRLNFEVPFVNTWVQRRAILEP